METKRFAEFELKAIGEEVEGPRKIAGWGNIYNITDKGKDIVLPGAFAKSLEVNSDIKMFFNHYHWETPIGKWTKIEETEKGLRVEGILADTEKGNEIYELIKINALNSLSIGYKANAVDYDDQDVRTISEAELFEVSVVTFPMNVESIIDSVKCAEMTVKQMEAHLVNSGLSKSVAKKLLARGWQGLGADQREADEAKAEILNAINNNINMF